MKYRKKPVVIDAIQLHQVIEHCVQDVFDFFDEQDKMPAFHIDREGVHIATLEGEMLARPGDWIIRGVKGEYYPCKPDIFAATYEQV